MSHALLHSAQLYFHNGAAGVGMALCGFGALLSEGTSHFRHHLAAADALRAVG